jgi:hypothetical protein
MMISELSDEEKTPRRTPGRTRKRTRWMGAPMFALAAVFILAGAPAATAAPVFTSNHVCPLSVGQPGGGNGCSPGPVPAGHQSIGMMSNRVFSSDCANAGPPNGDGGCVPGPGPGYPGGPGWWGWEHASNRGRPGCGNDPGLCGGERPGPGVTPSTSTDVVSSGSAGSPRLYGPLCGDKPGVCPS